MMKIKCVFNLDSRMDTLHSRLEKQTELLNNARNAIKDYNERTKVLVDSINSLGEEFNKMGHVARDLETLNYQHTEVKEFSVRVTQHYEKVKELSVISDQVSMS
jgi:hypothetical protein